MYLCAISSRLLLYDTNSWDLKKSYSCYDGTLRDVSWSDDSKYMLQVNAKGLVEILSPADYDVRSLQHIPLKDTWSACFHRDGHRNIAIGTKSGNVLIWDTKNKNITKTFPPPLQQSSVNHVNYNAKNSSLAASMHNGDTVIYSMLSNIPVLTVKLSCSKSISAMKFHHDSRSLLGFATDEGHVVIRDITTNKDKVMFENVHAAPVGDIAYSLINKDVMLSSGFDKIVNVYDVRLQTVVSLIRTTYPLTSISVNFENQVALGSKSGTVLIYDLRDFKHPVKVLKAQDEEIRKVSFQPVRKKNYSTEVSLREESESAVSPPKVSTPQNRTSEMFFNNPDTPPKNTTKEPSPNESNADSFLILLGLDKSNNAVDDDETSTNVMPKKCNYDSCVADSEKEIRKSDTFELRNNPVDAENEIYKMSTPLSNRTGELGFQSTPVFRVNGVPDDGRSSSNNKVSGVKLVENNAMNCVDVKVMEELKDFIKLTLADVADDNRNYFLHLMMALTKQKLYLEKQMFVMNEQMQALVLNQNALIETNRKLAMEIDQIKSPKNRCN